MLSASHFVSHGIPGKVLDVKVVLSEHKIDVQEETQTFQDTIDKGIQETRTGILKTEMESMDSKILNHSLQKTDPHSFQPLHLLPPNSIRLQLLDQGKVKLWKFSEKSEPNFGNELQKKSPFFSDHWK
ncbi:unnamed protein product [Lactuca saligna]|uniref:Uncharacterized protein n=1 Tax=Lactuca saligna TaxID=75948 RepID=A0AA36EIM3_LACSI|nr:unnamed protein product [Lactuca saligna]